MIDWNRLLSGALALGWLFLCGVGAGTVGVLQGILALILPIACIWFADELGGLTTTVPLLGDMPVTRESPGCAVRVLGWVALLSLTVVRVIIFMIMAP